MTLLRKCRVNAALTIQIFSHLFLSINTWLFNRIVCSTELNLCSYESAVKMTSHLLTLRQWTEKQGLELIFDYHLTKVNQLLTFLTSAALREDGFPVEPAEESNVRLPFVFPDDGYTCEYLQGIPHGLLEFIEKYIRVIPCRVFLHPTSLGYWTEFFSQPHSIETIRLTKRENSLGLSIVAAKVSRREQRWHPFDHFISFQSESQSCQGIYVREVVEKGVARQDGRLEPGDQLLAVDKTSLIDATQDEWAIPILFVDPSIVPSLQSGRTAEKMWIFSDLTSVEKCRFSSGNFLVDFSTNWAIVPTDGKHFSAFASTSTSSTESETEIGAAVHCSRPFQSAETLPIATESAHNSRAIATRDHPRRSADQTRWETSSGNRACDTVARCFVDSVRRNDEDEIDDHSSVGIFREKPRSLKIGEKRLLRVNRSNEEEKELKSVLRASSIRPRFPFRRLQLEEEFQRRFGQIQIPSNDDPNQTVNDRISFQPVLQPSRSFRRRAARWLTRRKNMMNGKIRFLRCSTSIFLGHH